MFHKRNYPYTITITTMAAPRGALLFAIIIWHTFVENSNIHNDNEHHWMADRDQLGRTRRSISIAEREHTRRRRSADCKDNLFMSCSEVSRICHCDQQCVAYNDCCYDAPIDLSVRHNKTLDMSCRKLFSTRWTSYWMVSGCPNTYTDQNIINKCKTYSIDGGDPHQIIPVFVTSQRRYFQNMYCAECHNISPLDFTPLTVFVEEGKGDSRNQT